MKKKEIASIVSYRFDDRQNHRLPDLLCQKIHGFISKSYYLTNQEDCNQMIIQPGKEGELALFFSQDDEVAGLFRTCKQSFTLDKKTVTAYTASVFLSPDYQLNPTIENTGIQQAIQHKLAHPQEELVYIAFANNPLTFKFFYELSDNLYPKPNQQIPNQIISILNALKQENLWVATQTHPMVIDFPLIPLRSYSNRIFEEQEDEINEFYHNLNPDYMQGNTLLVYIPLHLTNIGYGFNHLSTIKCNYVVSPAPVAPSSLEGVYVEKKLRL